MLNVFILFNDTRKKTHNILIFDKQLLCKNITWSKREASTEVKTVDVTFCVYIKST